MCFCIIVRYFVIVNDQPQVVQHTDVTMPSIARKFPVLLFMTKKTWGKTLIIPAKLRLSHDCSPTFHYAVNMNSGWMKICMFTQFKRTEARVVPRGSMFLFHI